MVDNVKTTTRATTHVHARMVIREEIVTYVRRLISKDFLNFDAANCYRFLKQQQKAIRNKSGEIEPYPKSCVY